MRITGSKVVLALADTSNMKRVHADDFIIHLRSFQGGIERSRIDGKVSPAYTVLSPRPGVVADYYRWVLKSEGYIQELRTTTNQLRDGQSIKYDDFAKVPLPKPEEGRQRLIAEFLDRETTQIDSLVTAQRELVRLLEERRLAVVVRAVTQGIDNNVALKASGQPWVSVIAEHWTMKRLSWLFAGIGSGTTPEAHLLLDGDAGDIPWVTTGELREGVIDQTSKSVSSETLSQVPALRVYPAGTLLIAMYGATIGRLGTLGVSACVNQACCAFSKPSGAVPRFVYYALLAAREHLITLASGGGQPNINQEKLRALRLPTPSVPEQQAIADHLDAVTGQMDAMIDAANESIALMLERRSALISAAVTGRIDPLTGKETKEAS